MGCHVVVSEELKKYIPCGICRIPVTIKGTNPTCGCLETRGSQVSFKPFDNKHYTSDGTENYSKISPESENQKEDEFNGDDLKNSSEKIQLTSPALVIATYIFVILRI